MHEISVFQASRFIGMQIVTAFRAEILLYIFFSKPYSRRTVKNVNRWAAKGVNSWYWHTFNSEGKYRKIHFSFYY